MRSVKDIGEFLTDSIVEFAQSEFCSAVMEKETEAFRFTFSTLASALGEDSFRRYDFDKQSYSGGFSLSAFEPMAIGLGFHFEEYVAASAPAVPDVASVSKELWKDKSFTANSGSGVRASTRIRNNVPLGRGMFAP